MDDISEATDETTSDVILEDQILTEPAALVALATPLAPEAPPKAAHCCAAIVEALARSACEQVDKAHAVISVK